MLCAKTDPNCISPVRNSRYCAKLLLAAFFLTTATATLAVQEIDPNNTCALAQNVGALSPNATITVNGALKTPPTVPDIDFYKFTGGTPGDLLRVTLRGAWDAVDTLTLPMAAVFASSCSFATFNSGAYDPISFEVIVPADGVAILAVTSCCDFSFTGAGSYAGSYTLTATEIATVSSISGQATDAVTAQGISAIQAYLYLCADPVCTTLTNFVAASSTDSLGNFTFTNNSFVSYGQGMVPGTYEVTLQDNSGRYLMTASAPFSAASGERKVIPNIAMTPTPVIGSISGRLVDSVTHAPLSGVGIPFAQISLSGCIQFVCSFISGYTDSSGRFKFDHGQSGNGIVATVPLSFYINADQYQQLFVSTPPIGVGVNQDLGDIQVASNPIRFSVLQGCSNVPLSGGVCQYQVEITNAIASAVEGVAWATIYAQNLSSFSYQSDFQTGEPREMYLAGATMTTRASRTATFQFTVPGTVPIYAFICPTFWFGTGGDNPQLSPQGQFNDYPDCVQRTAAGYTPATPDQIKALRKEAHEHEAKERAMVLPK
jgi:hypothetical protein